MPSLRISTILTAVALTWAIGVHSANAQESCKIQERLRQPITLHFKALPLKKVIKELATISGVSIVPDEIALTKARINMDAPLSTSVENIDMKFALNLLLRPLKLTYVIEDQLLKITTEERNMGNLYRVTYPVSDLVDPPPTIEGHKVAGTKLENELTQIITNAVAKDQWEPTGGRGTIQYLPKVKAFAIYQTQEPHEEIQLLLASLRRLLGPSVNIDVRLIEVSRATAKQWQKEIDRQNRRYVEVLPAITIRNLPNGYAREVQEEQQTWAFLDCKGPYKKPRPFAAMNDEHVGALLESAKIDQRFSIVQAPKLNLCSGQDFPFDCSKKEMARTEFRTPGDKSTTDKDTEITLSQAEKTINRWRLKVKPTVSGDRRLVRFSLSVEHFSNGDDRMATELNVNLPNGRTLVWHLGETATREHLFVLVTPRVISREAPTAFEGQVPPIPGR